jgi:hypothetical protein
VKRIIAVAVLFSVVLSGASLWQVMAQSSSMTEAHIARIKANCIDAQASLTQLHTSDALLRVNRGRMYESIATKLMVPLNSRIAANQLDGKSLVDIYTTYEVKLAEFRATYQSYEQSMSDVLRMNCQNQPVSFYDKVNATSELRKKVHTSVVALHKAINDYKAAFEAFAKKFEESTNE